MHLFRLSYRAPVLRSEKCQIHESWHFEVRGKRGKTTTLWWQNAWYCLGLCAGEICVYIWVSVKTPMPKYIQKKKKTITKALRIVLAIANAILYSEEEQRRRETESSNRIYDSQCKCSKSTLTHDKWKKLVPLWQLCTIKYITDVNANPETLSELSPDVRSL